jgi:hypothetical protein
VPALGFTFFKIFLCGEIEEDPSGKEKKFEVICKINSAGTYRWGP